MEILKIGGTFEEPQFVKKCKKCKTEFVYSREDLCTNNNCLKLYVRCPACEELLKVSRFDKKYRPDKHGDILTIPRKIGFNRW